MSKHVKKTILRAGVVLTILGSGTVVLTGISMLHPVVTLGISGLGVLLQISSGASSMTMKAMSNARLSITDSH